MRQNQSFVEAHHNADASVFDCSWDETNISFAVAHRSLTLTRHVQIASNDDAKFSAVVWKFTISTVPFLRPVHVKWLVPSSNT